MGYLFEHLVMRFNEQSNEEAGDHFTPREVIRLMANLIYTGEQDVYKPGIFRTIYDPACGTGEAFVLDDEVALRFFRLQQMTERSIDLSDGEADPLKGPTDVGTAQVKDEDVTLSSLIDRLNEHLTTPSGRALAGMLAVFAEFERDTLRDRVLVTAIRRKPSTPLPERDTSFPLILIGSITRFRFSYRTA